MLNHYLKLDIISHLNNRKLYQILFLKGTESRLAKNFENRIINKKIAIMKRFKGMLFPMCISIAICVSLKNNSNDSNNEKNNEKNNKNKNKNKYNSRIQYFFYDITNLSDFFYKNITLIQIFWNKNKLPNFIYLNEIDGIFYDILKHLHDDNSIYTFIKFTNDFRKINNVIIKLFLIKNLHKLFFRKTELGNPKIKISFPKKIYDSYPLIRF